MIDSMCEWNLILMEGISGVKSYCWAAAVCNLAAVLAIHPKAVLSSLSVAWKVKSFFG